MTRPATVLALQDSAQEFPRSAVSYAVRQLARRAGVSPELFRTWRIDASDFRFVSVYIKPGTNKVIRFPRADHEFWDSVRRGVFATSAASWLSDPDRWINLIPDFKIPFSNAVCDHVGPLFAIVSPDCITCSVDLLASIFLTLSRFEETLPGPRDEHGRFPSSCSVARRSGFLHRPIVDEYGIAFEQALSILLPNWRPAPRHLRVKVGHDVDQIGVPFSLQSTIGHTIRRRRPDATIRDLVAQIAPADAAYQRALRQLVEVSRKLGYDSAVYWKASALSAFDSGYDVRAPRIVKLIRDFQDVGVEMGVHPGYRSFDSPEVLCKEVSSLQELLGESQLGGRQDFLRWNPEMWSRWDSLGLAYDASVGFADHIGFRAGTCLPFRPWLLREQREANLLEIPLLAMDGTLFAYMHLEPSQALSDLCDLATRCSAFGGVFNLLWHHTTQFLRPWAEMYRNLLSYLNGADRYDWRNAKNGLE